MRAEKIWPLARARLRLEGIRFGLGAADKAEDLSHGDQPLEWGECQVGVGLLDRHITIRTTRLTVLRAGHASSSSSSVESDSESEEAFILDEDLISTMDPIQVNDANMHVLGGDRVGAQLFKTLEIKEGNKTTKYSLYDDCLVRAETSDGSKPPYIAKIVAIGTGGPPRQVITACYRIYVKLKGLRFSALTLKLAIDELPMVTMP